MAQFREALSAHAIAELLLASARKVRAQPNQHFVISEQQQLCSGLGWQSTGGHAVLFTLPRAVESCRNSV